MARPLYRQGPSIERRKVTKKSSVCSAVVLLAILALAACTTSSSQGPSAWLDDPLDGAKLPLAPTVIIAHASDADGVASFEFLIDGALLARAPADGGLLAHATVGWEPQAAGTYTVQARATDSQGNVGPEAVSVVTVGQLESSPSPSPTERPTEGTAPSVTPSREPPSSPVPTPTPRPPTATPRPPTATPIPPTRTPLPPTATPPPPARRPQITYFEADPGTINAGECSTLSWGVDYAAAVYLDGEGVVDHDELDVCLESTTMYTLRASSAGGEDQESVTVTVQQPHELTTDIAMTDLFPETPSGPVYGRLTNNGPDTLTNVTVQYQCQWDEIDRIEGVSHAYQVGPTAMTVISLSPGQTTPFNMDIAVDVTAYWYQITCRVLVDFDDPNLANNSYYEELL